MAAALPRPRASALPALPAILAAALLLCLAALWNGQPFFYPDTPTYLRGAEMGVARLVGPRAFKPWLPAREDTAPTSTDAPAATGLPSRHLKPLTSVEDKVVLAGRSVYYGALLYLGYVTGGMWLSVALQALSVAYVLHLLIVSLWGLDGLRVVGVAAALSVLSPLGVYTGFLMPDVFAPLVILSVALLAVYWQQLPGQHRWLLSALLLFALSTHASHFVLALLMLALALLARLISERWRSLSGVGLIMIAACLGGAVAAEWAFNKAVTAAVGAPPLRLPHPMARLIDLGPGTSYLKQHCPAAGNAGYAACAYVQNFPTAWDDFLFSSDPGKGAFALADADTKRRISAEQLAFVVDVLKHDPAGVIGGISADVLRQLILFQVDIWGYGETGIARFYQGRVPASVLATMQQSRAARPQPFNRLLTLASYASVLASLMLAAWWWWRRTRATARMPRTLPQRRFNDFAWIVIAGVVGNAVVCGTLASSLDRFQARVVWLLPFLALSALLLARIRQVSPSALSSPPSSSSLQGAPP